MTLSSGANSTIQREIFHGSEAATGTNSELDHTKLDFNWNDRNTFLCMTIKSVTRHCSNMNRKVLPNQLVTFFWSQYLTNIYTHHTISHNIRSKCFVKLSVLNDSNQILTGLQWHYITHQRNAYYQSVYEQMLQANVKIAFCISYQTIMITVIAEM